MIASVVTALRDRALGVIRDPNPILVKELRATFRSNLFIRFLYLATGCLGLVVLSGGAAIASASLPPAEVGQLVFQMFFGLSLLVILLIAPAQAATAFTSEKEQRTWESLVLSGMDPWRMVRGKFWACYASMFLVLISFAPVVGIAFLFGGISPWHVIWGYVWLLMWLAVAVAFGIAVSARLNSTRISILLVTLVFFPVTFVLACFIWAAGEGASSAWGVSMSGPFWFTEALSARLFELDTFGLLVALPMFVFGSAVWFFLATAVAGVRPAAEDRSTPLKTWSIVNACGLIATMFGIMVLFTDASDAGEAAIIFVVMLGTVLLFYAMLFMNEPPLPPRLVEMRRPQMNPLLRALLVVGPGAAPTLRFAFVLLIFASFGFSIAAGLGRHLVGSYPDGHLSDAGLIILAVGHLAVLAFVASFGTWLRIVLRSGIAARVLAFAAICAMAIVPFLFALIIDPDSLDRLDDEIPLMVTLSPLLPTILSINVADGELSGFSSAIVLVTAVVYGCLAAFFWVLVEARCAKVKRLAEEQRQARDERARTSVPSPPLLQRTSKPDVAAAPEAPAPEPAAEPPTPEEKPA